MNKFNVVPLWTIFLVLVILVGVRPCPAVSRDRLKIYVSVPPQAFLVNAIGREQVVVKSLIQGGADPHTFEVSPREVMDVYRADIYFTVGMGFEDNLVRKLQSVKQNFVIKTFKSLDKSEFSTDPVKGNNQMEDQHVWLSPQYLVEISQNIAAALQTIDGHHALAYQRNCQELIEKIHGIDAKIKEILAPYKGQSFYVIHPAFSHFAKHYGLKQKAVEMEGKSPTPRQLAKLIKEAKTDGIKVVFLQPQFDRKSGETLARAIGAKIFSADPLAEDVLNNLLTLADNLQKAFQGAK